MAVEAPSGIVKWYSHNLVGRRTLATLKGQLTIDWRETTWWF